MSLHLRCLSVLFTFILSILCLFPSSAIAAETDWQILGRFFENDLVADALNDAGIGVGAFVDLNIEKTQFTVWGNDQSVVFPGYTWKTIGSGSESDLTDAANAAGAVSATSTVNANNSWVLWGYVPN